jgi:phosphoribosylaminoimidazolecarboxamide formyltransferase/IMP cyclohydrolase
VAKNLRSMYLEINEDHFPQTLEISFSDAQGRQTLVYEKATWNIGGEERGLRYGENPDQEAAMYRLINGNLTLGNVENIQPGQYLASNVELLQSGKHPGKINITDVDSALNILRYLHQRPCTVIVKHNNPSGVAWGDSLLDAYNKAYLADRIAAFGGAVACNRPIDKVTAEAMTASYMEVVAAPDYEEGAMAVFEKKKNVRVMRIRDIQRLQDFVGRRVLDFKSLMAGGLIVQ